MSVVDVIKHYQRSIEKCSDDGQRMLHCLHKLFRLPVTVQHLKETGIGRTVNALRHHDGEVGDAAKTTVLKWKAMVAAEESSDGEGAGSSSEQVEEIRQNSKQDKEEKLKDKSKNSKIKEERSRSERHREEKRKDSKHKIEGNNHKPEASVDQRKYDKHKVSKEIQDHQSEREKISKESYSSSRKQKDVSKPDDKHSSSSRHSHKRKHKDSSTERRKEEKKRRKQQLEKSSDEEGNPEDDSDSKEMQIDERMYNEEYEPNSTSRTQEQNQDSDSNSSDVEGYSKENRSRNCSNNYSNSNSNSYNKHTSEQSHDVTRKHQKHKERSRGEERVHKSESGEKTNSSSSSSKLNSYKEKGHDSKDHKRSKSDTQKNELKKEKAEHIEKSKVKHNKIKTGEINSSSKKSKEKSVDNSSKEKTNKKVKLETLDDEGISSQSGASFAEALGMVDPIVKKRSSGTNSVSKAPRPSSGKAIGTHDNSDIKTKELPNKLPKAVPFIPEEPPFLAPSVKLEPLDVDLDSTLPEINPNYKPLPHINPDLFPRRSKLSEEEALSRVMSTKNQRTKVYSGVKSNKSWASTPSLFDICVRVLQENIDALEYTGGVPYDLLKPVLNHATPEQLLVLEDYNPYLVEDTDELWEFHCKKRFRTKVREDMETWREMFMRCSDEQEARLKALTTNISQTMKKSTPVRQTKLAYVEGVVKPPRNVAKQQAKYGTARMSPISKTSPLKGPKPSASSSSMTSVPPPTRAVHTAKVKHRMAPLMQKTMKLAKSFKR